MLLIPFYDPLPMLVLALLPTFDSITSHVGIHDMFVCNQDSLNPAWCKKLCKTTWKVMQDDVIRSFIAMTCEKLHVLLLLWHYYECEGFCGHWYNGVWRLISYEPKDNGGKLSLVITKKNSKNENLIISDIGLSITYHLLIAMLITCHIGLSYKLLANWSYCSLNKTFINCLNMLPLPLPPCVNGFLNMY